MKYQNITLSLPKETLMKVKLIAVKKNISVSKLLSKQLQDFVEKHEEYEKAKKRQIYLMNSGFDMQVKEKFSWRREELHDRS